MKVTQKKILCAAVPGDMLIIEDAPAFMNGVCIEVRTHSPNGVVSNLALIVLREDGLDELIAALKQTKAELAAALVINETRRTRQCHVPIDEEVE